METLKNQLIETAKELIRNSFRAKTEKDLINASMQAIDKLSIIEFDEGQKTEALVKHMMFDLN